MIRLEHKWMGPNRFCGTRDKGPIVYYAPREGGGCSENLVNKNLTALLILLLKNAFTCCAILPQTVLAFRVELD